MDLDLKSFSLTIGVGLALAGAVCAAIWVLNPERATTLLRRLAGDKEHVGVLASVAAAVVFLAVGLGCEDLSKNAVDSRDPLAFAPQLSAILTSELNQRCMAVLDDERTEQEKLSGRPRRSCTDDLEYRGLVPLTQPGIGAWNLIQSLESSGIASPEEERVSIQLREMFRTQPCDDAISLSQPRPYQCIRYSVDVRHAIGQLYYLAKNTAYTNMTFFHELEDFRIRYGFERSMAFALLLGVFVLSFLYLVKSTHNMWRDVGGWKSVISLFLALVLVVVLADVVAAPKWVMPQWAIERCVANAQHNEKREITKTGCKAATETARDWLLPAAFLFVGLYRLRRVFRRAGPWLAWSMVSTIPGPQLIQTARELEACRAFVIASILIAAQFPVYAAYQSDQANYLSRVFAYYESVRGPALQCGRTPVGTLPDCKGRAADGKATAPGT